MKYRLFVLLLLAGCKVGPDYHRPAAAGVTAAFKEAPPGWTVAQPLDGVAKGVWWDVYHDPLLDLLERRVAIDNQNVRQFAAQYREAQATVDIARSALFPTLNGTASVIRSMRGGSSVGSTTGLGGTTGTALGGTTSSTLTGTGLTTGTTATGTTGTTTSGTRATTIYTLEGSANWDLDVWGRIRRQVESDVAAAQVGAADLANATLSAQALLATDYFELRSQDALGKLLTDTLKAYGDTLRITRNQYEAGTMDASALAQAQTQYDTAQALLINVGVLRAQYEHAIAVLTGAAPADLSIPPGTLAQDVPVAPGVIPSVLLQRRPDIAAAERAMQQQNALIGVQVAAFYPDISLSALYGYSGNPLGSLIQAANKVWSLGAAGTETLVERHSRFVMLVQVDGKDSNSVVSALIRQAGRLPEGMMSSLTWDRGAELAMHKRFTMATDADVFFCDPRSPWQRGSNENTNGLLRQYLLKGSDLSGYTQTDLDGIALKLNTRPRKTLGFRTPGATFADAVAMTG